MQNAVLKTGGSPRFSAVASHNGQIHLAGQVSQLHDGDIIAQSDDVFSKIDTLLEQAGTTKSNLISVQVWLANMDDYEGMNAAWDNWVRDVAPPTRVCVEARLAKPHYKIEALAIAAV